MKVEVGVCTDDRPLGDRVAQILGHRTRVTRGLRLAELLACPRSRFGAVVVDSASRVPELLAYAMSADCVTSPLIVVTTQPADFIDMRILSTGKINVLSTGKINAVLDSEGLSRSLPRCVESIDHRGCYLDCATLAKLQPLFFRCEFTSREQETLQLLRCGYSNAVIAHRMRIRQRTVKYHIANIMNKLGARNRWEAVVLSEGDSISARSNRG